MRTAAPSSARPFASHGALLSAPPPPNPEADRAIEKAEMHFVVGDRPQALNLVREALTLSPKMPAGLVMLAVLEASNVREGHEDKLRNIIQRLDSILAADPKCRRGRYYRAKLRKRVGDLEGAIDDLREAVAIDSEDVDAQRELKACERSEREGRESQKPLSFLDRLRGR
jgi:tetratricopeptide (TPR) repeat protein